MSTDHRLGSPRWPGSRAPGRWTLALGVAALGLAACAGPPTPATPTAAEPPVGAAPAEPPTAPTPPVAPTRPRPPAEPGGGEPTCPDLFAAARDGHAERLRAWRDAGADLDGRCGSRTPLGLAAMLCDSAAVDLLLDLGADPDVCVPLLGRSTCGSMGGLGSVVHGRYPLGEAERMLRLAESSGDADDIAACTAVRDRLAERTGRVPEDLRPAR